MDLYNADGSYDLSDTDGIVDIDDMSDEEFDSWCSRRETMAMDQARRIDALEKNMDRLEEEERRPEEDDLPTS